MTIPNDQRKDAFRKMKIIASFITTGTALMKLNIKTFPALKENIKLFTIIVYDNYIFALNYSIGKNVINYYDSIISAPVSSFDYYYCLV